jgi:D-3-phosphoglycerate dehydrogenase
MMVLNVDTDVSDAILEEVGKVPGILNAKLVTLLKS